MVSNKNSPESERSEKRRKEHYAEHEVLDYIYHEHTMNGNECTNPWVVMKFRKTGSIGFYCGECRVGIHSGSRYEDLLELTDVSETTNPNS